MNYRTRQRIKIILALFIIFGSVAFFVYYFNFRKAPTCFDGKRNQSEAEIDCGGPCESCERATIKQLEILSAGAYHLKDNSYDLAGSILNPNPNFGLAEFGYVFRYFDAAGELLGEKKGKSYILPRQQKSVVEANIFASRAIGRVELLIENSPGQKWQRLKNNFEAPRIYAHDVKFTPMENQNVMAEAAGIIKNDSLFDFDKIGIVVTLYDEQNKIIGFNKTEINTVLAGEERHFSALWFNRFSAEVARVVVDAETNLFSQENFIKQYGVQDESQIIPEATKRF